jgi:glycosyltransferase involved in cell wall biosynthesis
MHKAISIIIIAKNEAHIIGKTIDAVKNLSDDIVVIENNSNDNTAEIATAAGAKVITCEWLGYGNTKNYGHSIAKYNWILSLDADEIVDSDLNNAISDLDFDNINIKTVFECTRKLVWENTILHFGNSKEKKIRIFNKANASWDDKLAHENLIFIDKKINIITLKGTLLHYCYKSEQDALEKFDAYAKIMAQQKFNIGTRTNFLKAKFAAPLNYWKNYFVKSAWRDGAPGLAYAHLYREYTFKKYFYLWQLEQETKKIMTVK